MSLTLEYTNIHSEEAHGLISWVNSDNAFLSVVSVNHFVSSVQRRYVSIESNDRSEFNFLSGPSLNMCVSDDPVGDADGNIVAFVDNTDTSLFIQSTQPWAWTNCGDNGDTCDDTWTNGFKIEGNSATPRFLSFSFTSFSSFRFILFFIFFHFISSFLISAPVGLLRECTWRRLSRRAAVSLRFPS